MPFLDDFYMFSVISKFFETVDLCLDPDTDLSKIL